MKKNWEIRRDMMHEAWTAEQKNVAYVVIDLFDWNTNTKRFKDRAAMTGWAMAVCQEYHLDKKAFKSGWEHLLNEGYLDIAMSERGQIEVTVDSPEPVEASEDFDLAI